MKNVTISMDEKLAREVRIEAARAGKSMSKYIAEVVEAALKQPIDADAERRRKIDAMERFLAGPKLHIAVDGKMPTAEERNARR